MPGSSPRSDKLRADQWRAGTAVTAIASPIFTRSSQSRASAVTAEAVLFDRGRTVLEVTFTSRTRALFRCPLEFTVEDEGVFTMPWSATITYRRGLDDSVEIICAENLHATYVARADKADF
jgi:hypothetical protein